MRGFLKERAGVLDRGRTGICAPLCSADFVRRRAHFPEVSKWDPFRSVPAMLAVPARRQLSREPQT
jgi:hypothetical protein